VSKRDKLGIYLKIENCCLEIITFLINASLEIKTAKYPFLNSARIQTETLKRLLRLAFELKAVNHKNYLNWEHNLYEISKMINGWIGYINKNK
jgi:hypothetical protein